MIDQWPDFHLLHQGDNYLRELAIFKNNVPLKHPHRAIEKAFSETYGIPLYRKQLLPFRFNLWICKTRHH